MFYTIDGREVVIIPADFMIWSLEASIIADQLSNNNLKKEIYFIIRR